MRVHEFSLGFGLPFGIKERGYGVFCSRLPLGGFVKLAGMDLPEDEADIVDDSDAASFNSKSLGQRLAVIAAGPVMNLILATVLFALYMGLVVIPPTVQGVEPGSPAEIAGLLPGDEITHVAGQEIDSVQDINRIVGAYLDQEISVAVARDGDLSSWSLCLTES